MVNQLKHDSIGNYHIAGNFRREIFLEISEMLYTFRNLFPKNFCVSVGNERL